MNDGLQKLPDFSAHIKIFQGGAIFVNSAEVKIYTSTFESNAANNVSW
jgi:hypothetical protein